eukprot:357771-Chlamydomonas_euryale.AAC.1
MPSMLVWSAEGGVLVSLAGAVVMVGGGGECGCAEVGGDARWGLDRNRSHGLTWDVAVASPQAVKPDASSNRVASPQAVKPDASSNKVASPQAARTDASSYRVPCHIDCVGLW